MVDEKDFDEHLKEAEQRRREVWKLSKAAELKRRITALAQKLVRTTAEVQRFGPQSFRVKLKTFYRERSGMVRHWHKMARQSLMSTRKKIYRLEKEMKSL